MLNTKRLSLLLASSIFIGIVFNFFNPSGIPLLREQLELEWADDSLVNVKNNSLDSDSSDTIISNDNSFEKKIMAEDSKELKEKKQESSEQQDQEGNSKSESLTEPKAITLSQAYSLYNEKHIFIDAREVADYEEGHILGAINIPFYQFDENKHKLENINYDETLITYCSGTDCELSILLGNQLFEMGYKKVFIFFGGWPEWIEAKYPVTLKNNESQEL